MHNHTLNPSLLEVSRSNQRFRLQATIVPMGNDLSIALFGGDRPHIGATALAFPTTESKVGPAIEPEGKSSKQAANKPTISVKSVPGHREDQLAADLAGKMASALGVTVSLTCGIHLDNITKQEIEEVLSMAEALIQDVLNRLR